MVFQVVSFLLVFRLKFCMHFCFPRKCHKSRLSHPPWWRVYIMKVLLMLFSQVSCFLSWPRYLPPNRVLNYPQPIFFSDYEGPGFTSIQNNRQNYRCVCVCARARARQVFISRDVRNVSVHWVVQCSALVHRRSMDLNLATRQSLIL
jgi:hypothetical protein